MLPSLLYFAVCHLLRLLTGGSECDDAAREIEILVLRHQLRVLGRARRMPLRRSDRVLPGGSQRAAGAKSLALVSRLKRRRCCAGIASWCGASGPTDGSGGRAGQG